MSRLQHRANRRVSTLASTFLVIAFALLPAACAPRVLTKEQVALMRASLKESPFVRKAVTADCASKGGPSNLSAEDYTKIKVSPQASTEEICEALVKAFMDGKIEPPNSLL